MDKLSTYELLLSRSTAHLVHWLNLMEQPLLEEPEDQEPDLQQEDQQQAADFAPEETDPSEEGMEFLFVLVSEEGLLSSGVRSVMLARSNIGGHDVALFLQVF
ncbi:hypothetical protein U9M48_005472 [Paspalum notatum var. saurae]|uniref:Uncharacterized protein n=1 Tax=Paspalum notatum var. saurae TaxID=547442 RepID=A0AAQ3PSC3_PASNO